MARVWSVSTITAAVGLCRVPSGMSLCGLVLMALVVAALLTDHRVGIGAVVVRLFSTQATLMGEILAPSQLTMSLLQTTAAQAIPTPSLPAQPVQTAELWAAELEGLAECRHPSPAEVEAAAKAAATAEAAAAAVTKTQLAQFQALHKHDVTLYATAERVFRRQYYHRFGRLPS